jgi:hypothetical protein
MPWKKHTDSIIGKLSKACYIIRKSKQYLCTDALKMVYYAFFHSKMSSGLIFWGNRTQHECIQTAKESGSKNGKGEGGSYPCNRPWRPIGL